MSFNLNDLLDWWQSLTPLQREFIMFEAYYKEAMK